MWYKATYLKEASIVSDGILSTWLVELQTSRSLAPVVDFVFFKFSPVSYWMRWTCMTCSSVDKMHFLDTQGVVEGPNR